MSDTIIKVKNLKKIYGELTVLQNIDFKIRRGEIFLIAGGSGCGKSTLLRQMIGLEEPTDGLVEIDGLNFQDNYSEIINKIGILFQSGGLFASMTLAENIAVVLKKHTDLSEDSIAEIIDMKLRAVGLEGFDGYLPNEISGGMKKRAALARAMALDPEILFFDEPSSGLDPLTSAEMDSLIKDINKNLGTTMVIISHDLASIINIADRILMLDKSVKGTLIIGTPEELKNNENELVHRFFNRETKEDYLNQ